MKNLMNGLFWFMIRSLKLAKWAIPERFLQIKLMEGRSEDLNASKAFAWIDRRARVSFNTSETVSGAVNETNVEISGLKTDTMAFLATSYTPWTKNYKRNSLILDAGYVDNHSIIFKGDIIEAVPNVDSADFSIKLKCMSYYETLLNDASSFTFEGENKASEIASNFADKLKFSFVNGLKSAEDDIEVNNYSYKDQSPIQHMRNLSQMTGLDIWTSNERLFIKKRGEELSNIPILNIDYNNLIGSPRPTAIGCDVSVRLNPSIMTGQRVKLKSLRFPILNSSEYVIQTFSHSGETMGSKWQTNLTLIRKDIYEQ